MRGLILVLFFLSSIAAHAQDFFTLRGYVFSEDNQALPSASIRLVDLQTGTQTNPEGQYELFLEEGLHRFNVSYIGHKNATFELVLDRDMVYNIFLKPSQTELSEVVVNIKKRDYSYTVIQNVIENKDKILNQYENYSALVYIKSIEEPVDVKPPKNDEDPFKKDSLPGYNFFEANITRFVQNPNKLKEERTAVKKIGEQETLFAATTGNGIFNIYQNLQGIKRLSENLFVSPISAVGMMSYKYRMIDSYYLGDSLVFRISVKPKSIGNALYEGEIEVYDKIWALKSLSLKLPKKALLIYDQFSLTQQFEEIEDKWMPVSETFAWKVKEGGQIKTGEALIRHSEFVFDSSYVKNFFGAEIGRTVPLAYSRDSTFWEDIRPDPLSKIEYDVIQKQEALDLKMNSKGYLDSMDVIYNKITFPKLIWEGFGYINRDKKYNWEFSPVLGLINPIAIGGWRIQYQVSFFKRYENRKQFRVSPYLNYGFLNHDLRGNLTMDYLYDPIRRSNIFISLGQGFDVINGAATISDIARRDNFYINNFVIVNHRTEILNGLYLNTGLNFSKREDFGDFKFAKIGDNIFEENEPLKFPSTNIINANIGFEFTPRQLYVSEPMEKIILGSKFPTFGVSFNKAWDITNTKEPKDAFTSIEFSIAQNFNLGIFGTSQYKFKTGKFLDTTSLSPMDYTYQRGGDPIWFSPSMQTFQLIPNTFTTFDWYFEAHYEHQFNGFLMSKIPLLNKTGIKSVAGAGLLYVPEHKYQYSELYAGVNRIFRLGKSRFRIGAYYVTAQSKQFGFRSGFKFSFEPYNRSKNTWSF